MISYDVFVKTRKQKNYKYLTGIQKQCSYSDIIYNELNIQEPKNIKFEIQTMFEYEAISFQHGNKDYSIVCYSD